MSRFFAIAERLDEFKRRAMYRRRRVVTSPQGREITVDGRRLLNFCSNDYLGLAGDPRVRAAMVEGVERWGVGAGASHLVCGHTAAHHALEEALADFTGRPRALLFGSGYAANMGAIGALVGPGDRVFEDRLNHASLLDGGWISRAGFCWFRHRDMADLEKKLATAVQAPVNVPADGPAGIATGSHGQKLIVSDGTFSMDGDVCPLPELVELSRAHGAWLMIDDAHGMGAHGRDGRGVVDPDEFTTGDVPVLVGTLGKAFGTAGAFVAGSDDLIELLVQRARSYIYTTALPAAVAVASLRSLEIARAEEWRRELLRTLIARFRNGARDLGLELLPSGTPIQPVIIGDPGRAVAVSRALEERGCLVTAIRPPTVPKGTSRLRITFTAALTEADVDTLLAALDDVSGPAGLP